MADPSPVPTDQPARELVASDLGRTLFVEAGAGSGKTSALVERVVALVVTGTCPLPAIAAITFTEKAAAELRVRLRSALIAGATGDDLKAARCRQALDDLDGAAIGTLHGFARRLLSEHPVEAGLPPRVEVLDEIASQIEFEGRWRDQLQELLDDTRLRADPELERTLLIGREAGLQLNHLRQVALAFDRDWDLVAERVPATAPPMPLIDVTAVVARLRQLAARRHDAIVGDLLAERLAGLEPLADGLERADEIVQLRWLAHKIPRNKVGRQNNWPEGKEQTEAILADLAEVGDWMIEIRDTVLDGCLQRLAVEIAAFTLAGAQARRRAGRLVFHDLLTLARGLLRDPRHGPAVRRRLHDRYRRLLLDEFQDTDPIQIELATLLASAPDDPVGHWSVAQPIDGRLFFVGDPKQSIYRFRRADIATYLSARRSLGAEVVSLTTNFRSTRPVIDWVNHVFGQLIRPVESMQPEYQPLTAVIDPPAGPAVGVIAPAVVVVGSRHDDDPRAAELRRRESHDVAAAIVTARRDGWPVRDEHGAWRPPRLADIAVLLPTRASLPMLEDALDAAGVPFRTESSSLVYASREVRDLLMTLRAVADPSDELAVVSALRSAVYGCSDLDLFEHRRAERSGWNFLVARTVADGSTSPVLDAFDHLRSLHDRAHWLAPAELLDRIARERRLFELGAVADVGNRHRDVWRRLRFVIDQARAWADAGGSALRDYLAWTQRQGEEGARVAEAVLPETDDDAVRIMTVHAAKGLEFPIVVVAGLTTEPRRGPPGPQVTWHASSYQIRIRAGVATREFEAMRQLDEQMDHHERVRLLYVACTRARDHLVVSVHHAAKQLKPDPTRVTSAVLLAGAVADAPHQQSLAAGATALVGEPTPPVAPTPVVPAPVDVEWWRREHERVVTVGARATSISASALAAMAPTTTSVASDAGLAKEGRDLDLPPWHKGRYGTAIGRAVHAVLQTIDLGTGAGLDDAVTAQAAAEGVLGLEPTIAALARAALAAPSVRAASRSEHWREVYVGVPTAGPLLEGYIDLLYRRHDGLVVIDHKTDAVSNESDIDERLQRYRRQGAAYALAVEQAAGEPVVECVFVFCTPNGPIERAITDLGAAMAEVRALLDAG